LRSLPDFYPISGYLPQGIHQATHEEMRERLVTEPLKSITSVDSNRESMFTGYERLVSAIQLVGIPTSQWIGGSYVSTHPTPSDIDLVNYCDVVIYESLSAESKAMIKQYFLGKDTARHCFCDSYFVPAPPEDSPNKEDFLIIAAYWKKKLGYDRIGRSKGIISRLVKIETASIDAEEHTDATTS
jgi:hypothetical protein